METTVKNNVNATKKKIGIIFNGMQKTIDYLYSRWQDEREYEDWDTYEDHIRKQFNDIIHKGNIAANIIMIQKRPFGLTFDIGGFRVKIKATSKAYSAEMRKNNP